MCHPLNFFGGGGVISGTFPLSAAVISGLALRGSLGVGSSGERFIWCGGSVSAHSRINWIRRIYGTPDCGSLGVMRTF